MIKKPAMGTFHKWWYPNNWMVYYNGNPDKMDDEMGCPHDEMEPWNPPSEFPRRLLLRPPRLLAFGRSWHGILCALPRFGAPFSAPGSWYGHMGWQESRMDVAISCHINMFSDVFRTKILPLSSLKPRFFFSVRWSDPSKEGIRRSEKTNFQIRCQFCTPVSFEATKSTNTDAWFTSKMNHSFVRNPGVGGPQFTS